MFITFEGIEGSGKSTQIQMLKEFFEKKSLKAFFTKEPGSSEIGKEIRSILLNKENKIYPQTEIFLIFADRVQHVQEIIKPNLNEGKIVVSDRYYDSSVAYQGQREGISKIEIYELIENLDLPTPDITFLLDLPANVGLKRAKNRASLDRFESEEISFHEGVRQNYLDLQEQNLERIVKIDATQSPNEIFSNIIKRIKIE
tara:strand:- start:1615 stop:2214 length:600 start_codon:yes stop_codon:yes gene_type:complete